jgi:REP element-mobilizing transposase RayT
VTLYTAENIRLPAYQLRFSWTCWPSAPGEFPAPLAGNVLRELEAQWEMDGIRSLESKWLPHQIQLTVSVKPQVSPVFLAARLKGRLQYALRQAGTPVQFSRKLSVRSLGDARSTEVASYITNQVHSEQFADSKVEAILSRMTVTNPDVDLAVPSESNSGRYWYNLHLVLVVARREKHFEANRLAALRDGCFKIAAQQGYRISALSVMPDHVHIALRGRIEHCAEEVALSFLNGLSEAVGQSPIWEFGYYAGTFGEYDMGSVRRSAQPASPAGQAGRGRGQSSTA